MIGADSTLARDFIARYAGAGLVLTTTSRRHSSAAQQVPCHIQLDLADGRVPSQLLSQVFDVVIVYAAMTNIAACEQQQALAQQINCDSVVRLMLAVQARHWILLSTNLVFSGTTPNLKWDTPYAAFNHYGASKVAMEKAALTLPKSLAIVRLSKVLTPRFRFFQNAIDRLSAKQTCEVFHDMTMAPIWIADVSRVIYGLVKQFRPGVVQLSASRDISYADAIGYCAARLGLPTSLVIAVSKTVPSPRFNSLACGNNERQLGFATATPYAALDQLIDTMDLDRSSGLTQQCRHEEQK